jgi:hypothetical protein
MNVVLTAILKQSASRQFNKIDWQVGLCGIKEILFPSNTVIFIY